MKGKDITIGHERVNGTRWTVTCVNKDQALKFVKSLIDSGKIKDNYKQIGKSQIKAYRNGEI